MKKVNVLHLKSGYRGLPHDAGVETLLLLLAEKVDPARFRFIFVSLRNPALPESTLFMRARARGVQTDFVPWGKPKAFYTLFITIPRIIGLIKKYDVHILHTHDFRAEIIGCLAKASRLIKVPLIASKHGYGTTSVRSRIHEFLANKMATRFSDRIIAGSTHFREHIIRLGTSAKKVTEITNAIDIAKIKITNDSEGIKRNLNIKPNSPIIGAVGRLQGEKGHKFLLEAAQRVITFYPRAVFLIVGEGPSKGELEDLAEELGVFKNVIFLNYQEDILSLFNVMDIFVLSSITESLPLALLEAMAAARPVVATNVGDVARAIKSNETGILVPPRDGVAMSEAILSLLANEEKAKKMGSAGRSVVTKEFSADAMAKKFEAIYEDLFLEKNEFSKDEGEEICPMLY